MPPQKTDRILQLDALRGVAAVWVMLYHYTIQYSGDYGHGPGVWRVAYGQRAVELFFMISGFVIPMTLARTRRAKDFLVSRFSRLYPAFWACLAITTLVVAVAGLPPMRISAVDVLANVTMAPNLLFHRKYVDHSYWTLEFELLFYAFSFLGWRVKGMAGVGGVIVGLTTLSLIEGLTRLALGGLVDSLLLQYAIAYFACGYGLYRVRIDRAPRIGGAIVLLGLATVLAREGLIYFTIDVGLVALVMAAAFDRVPGLSLRPLLWLGMISYPLYLLHQNIGYITISSGYAHGLPANVNVILAIVVAVALATAVSLLIERPAMHWIRRRYNRPASHSA